MTGIGVNTRIVQSPIRPAFSIPFILAHSKRKDPSQQNIFFDEGF